MTILADEKCTSGVLFFLNEDFQLAGEEVEITRGSGRQEAEVVILVLAGEVIHRRSL